MRIAAITIAIRDTDLLRDLGSWLLALSSETYDGGHARLSDFFSSSAVKDVAFAFPITRSPDHARSPDLSPCLRASVVGFAFPFSASSASSAVNGFR